jgi:type I restriction enzyme S subunit
MTSDGKQLPKHWDIKRLGDVCKTGAGGTPLKANREYYEGGTIPWLLSGEVAQGEIAESKNFITQAGLDNSSAKIFPVNTVLVAMYGATAGQVGILRFEAATNQAVCGIYPNKKLVPEFIYYAMLSKQEELIAKAAGNAQPNISQIKVKNTEVPIPPIAEQRRIVAILDEAFEGIDGAIANTKKNLANAHELFESYLNSLDAEKRSLGDLVDIRTGKLNANAAVEGGQYPFFTCSREIYQIDNYAFDCEAILLAGNNAVGDFNVKHYRGKFNAYQRTYVITVNQNKEVIYRYLYFQLLKSLKEFKTKSVGAGTRFLKLDMIKDLQISLPGLDEQEKIVSVLDELEEAVQELETIYKRKLAALNELKQSILQKALSGELTAEVRDRAVEGTKDVLAA